ncbi:MAG TPA: cytochrome c biogenesis protein CcdA [Ferruginibacter sp.]|nr:cytochrome c biogenesis protein CcdA [Ferruginibacter sp.]
MRLNFFLTTVCFFFLFNSGIAQDSSIVNWTAVSQKAADKNFDIILKGTIKKGWHLYAKPDAGLGITGLQVTVKSGDLKAEPIVIQSPLVDYTDLLFENSLQKVAKENIEIKIPVAAAGAVPASANVLLQYETASGADQFIPEEKTLAVSFEGGLQLQKTNPILVPSINLEKPAINFGASEHAQSKGLLSIFVLGFLGGLVALLTPCVFPMIPLTVSFFTKKSGSRKSGIRNAFLYGFFIFIIYVLLSLPFHFIGGLKPEIFNNISTNVYLNVAFFVIFIVFALSFFGLFEISLPGAVGNTADSKANVGSVVGIFFMALTLAIVSFSCTGPILGSLLAGSLTADGGAMQLTTGMAGFGLALALPFALFAMFPGWLNALPKSGGWLTSVKIVLGFLEVALAFKFLSNADLVMHWGFLKREIFIGIWVIVFALLSLYLFGIIKFKSEAPIKKLPIVRLVLAIVTGAFTLYLLPGLTNNPKWNNLSLISGFPPPLYYSIYKQKSDCVLNLNCTRDYATGVQMAKEQNKAILVDFTGYACVNCRRMEENVWTQPEVYKLLHDKFIIISLYVDDKKELPAAEQFTYTFKDGSTKEIKTVGDKWATFQTENFKNNSQPWYAVLNTNEELMTHPVGYVPDWREYLAWLQKGLEGVEAK